MSVFANVFPTILSAPKVAITFSTSVMMSLSLPLPDTNKVTAFPASPKAILILFALPNEL
jgi:hypothetical protein